MKIDLPKASSSPNLTQLEHIQLAIRENGDIYWNGEPVVTVELAKHLSQAAAKQPQPELHIRADRLVHYEKVAQVMSLAARAGLVRIGFVTEPNSKE